MKKNQVKVGGMYTAKVSDKLVTVRIDSTHSAGGWHATNTATGKRIRVRSAQRLRGAVKGPAKVDAKKVKATGGGAKPKRVSALDAAAQILKSAGKPMRAQELIAAMAEQNLWKSPGGATPWATIYTVWTMLAKAA